MIPLILVSRNQQETEAYLNNFIQRNKFSPFYIFRYYPSPKIIKISQIKEIKSRLIRVDKNKKLIIIYHFDTAKIETQNAFLKTLEEKSNRVEFIITTSDESQLLPTILSRGKVIKLKSQPPQGSLSPPFLSQSLARLLLDYSNINQQKAIEACDQFLLFFKQKIIKEPSVTKILKEVVKTRNLIIKNNLNPQIAIDHLLIFMRKCLTIKKYRNEPG